MDIYTPVQHTDDLSLAGPNDRLAFWKQILPMKKIEYTAKDGSRQTVNFDKQYLTDLANNKAVDQIGFLLADKDNAHTMDPDRWRGQVAQMEVRDDGLYGKIVFPSAEAAAAVLANPDLGVSARIREGVAKSDGSSISRGIIHVLGTLDPQVSGMAPWQATDLSNESDTVLDLTNERFEDMAGKKALSDFTEADIDAMDESALDAFLAEFAPEFDETLFEDEDDSDLDDDDDAQDQNRVLVQAGADMSKVREDIELANGRASYAEAQARQALTMLAAAEWKSERDVLLSAGVPPHMLDLAAPVMSRAGGITIDLSNEDGDDLDVTTLVRGLLEAAKGTVDLSNEEGHNGHFRMGDGDDPDAELLEAWKF